MTTNATEILALLTRRRQHAFHLWHEPRSGKVTIGRSVFMSKVFNE